VYPFSKGRASHLAAAELTVCRTVEWFVRSRSVWAAILVAIFFDPLQQFRDFPQKSIPIAWGDVQPDQHILVCGQDAPITA